MLDLVGALREALGDSNVVSDVSRLEQLSRTNIPYREIPDIIVYPTSVEHVQAVMTIARRHRIPVWPVSTGKNWGYGTKSACYPGGITMILERMTRIHHVDASLGYAVIEPGVTYRQLHDYLKDHKLGLWSDAAGSTESASVIGNALDKGRGLTPYADHFGSLCGLEVVLPDGRLLRTGGGPEHDHKAWNTYKWGTGPYLDGLFAQSSYGIVVKAGVWLMPQPECFDFLAFEYTADESRFPAFIDDFRRLIFRGAIRSRPHLANDFAMLCIVSQYPWDLLGDRRYLDEAAMETWRRRHGVARWTFGCGLYGTRAEVRLQKKMIKKGLRPYGTMRFLGGCAQPGWKGRLMLASARLVAQLQGKSPQFLDAIIPAVELFKGVPTDYFVRQVYFKSHAEKPARDIDPARDGCGFMWIGPVAPFTSTHVAQTLELARPIYRTYGFDFFVELIVESARAMIVLFGIFYDKKSEADSTRATDWYAAMKDCFMEHGYPPYRASVHTTAHAFESNPVFESVVRDIKSALDPGNIVAPGRYGAPMKASESPRLR